MPYRGVVTLGRVVAVVLLFAVISVGGCRTAKAAPVVPADGYGFAVGASAQWTPAKDVGHELDAVGLTRASWLRVLIDWSRVEPVKDQYDWSYVDTWINGAFARGLKVLGLISYTAEWARPEGSAFSAPPGDPADFAEFATLVVQRYGNRVHNWEVWNEPNLPIFFGYTDGTAERYTELLKLTYPAIKKVQPDATVLAAGLSRSPGTEAPSVFLQRMYAAGAGGFFDATAAHPYIFATDWLTPEQQDGWAEVVRMHDVMTAHGDGAKKIWLTELGAPTSDPGAQGGVSQQDQAKQITQVLAAAAASGYCGPAFIYSIRDIDTGQRDDPQDNFGALLTTDWKPKVIAHQLVL